MKVLEEVALLVVHAHDVLQKRRLVRVKEVCSQGGEHEVVDVGPDLASPVVLALSEQLVALAQRLDAVRLHLTTRLSGAPH